MRRWRAWLVLLRIGLAHLLACLRAPICRCPFGRLVFQRMILSNANLYDANAMLQKRHRRAGAGCYLLLIIKAVR